MYFPELQTVDPLLNAVKDMPEIAVHEDTTHGYGFIMYQVAFEETFADPLLATTPEEKFRRELLREARGLKYCLATRRVVSRPYHKFFNVGEKPETQPDKIDWTRPHVILEKLDGSMLTPLLLDWEFGRIHWMTKRGVTGVTETAKDWLTDNPQYEGFIRNMTRFGMTPIFEWCTRKQRIILDYGVDRMVLTGLRQNVSGTYIGYKEMVEIAQSYGIDYVNELGISVTDIDEFIKHTRALEGEEGYIIRFDTGEMYKIKGEWYCRIHKTFDNLRFEKDVIRLILSGDLDDAKPFLVPTLLGAVDRFHHAMIDELRKSASYAYWHYVTAKDNLNGSKKLYAAEVLADEKASQHKKYLFGAFDRDFTEEELLAIMIQDVIDHTTGSSAVDRMRFLIGGINWRMYLDEPTDTE